MKTPHIVHLSTYPADDIRVFQKTCKSEVAEGYRVTQIVCDARNETVDGVETSSQRTPLAHDWALLEDVPGG